MINQINLVGRLGQDPNIVYFESGSCKCTNSLAVNRPKKKDTPNEDPDWFSLECWGKTAEILANYGQKGSLIGVTGELKFETWQDRYTGEDRRKLVVKVNNLYLLGSKSDSQQQAQPKPQYDGIPDF